jgi:metallophosphoesterase (TIGR00282 family)
MKILTIGDVVGSSGCEYLRKVLPNLKRELKIDLTICNGENSADGNGCTPYSSNFLLDSGADVLTGGNHSLRRRENYATLENANIPVLRPANFYKTAPGSGVFVLDKGFVQVAVFNLIGNVYSPVNFENVFETLDRLIDGHKHCKIKILDFHAEATAEKRALGFYADGRISAFFGTHTHTQTADEQILPGGTGYITDIGMTGPVQSVLGIEPKLAIEKMKTGMPVKFDYAKSDCRLCGCIFDVDETTGKCLSVKRVNV